MSLNVSDSKLSGAAPGTGREDQATMVNDQLIDLELKAAQRLGINKHLDLGNSEFGTRGVLSFPEADVLGDNAFEPAQPQPRKLQIYPLLMQFLQQRAFQKTGQAYLVQVNEAANQQQDEEPNRDPEPPEVKPASSPEPFPAGWPCWCFGHGIDR